MITTSRLRLKLPQDGDLVTPEDANGNFKTIEGYITTLTQAASAHAPAALNLTNQYKAVSFGSITRTGYALSLSGGGIRTSEPGFVRVHLHVYANSLPAGDSLEARICKNGVSVSDSEYTAVDSDSTYVIVDLVSRLIPVAANDVLTMSVRNWEYVRGKIVPASTHMTVDLFKNLNY